MKPQGHGFAWRKRAAAALLATLILAGCGAEPSQAPPTVPTLTGSAVAPEVPTVTIIPTTVPQPTRSPSISGYEFPAVITPSSRYLFYLHGKIIEDQGLPAVSPEYGEYEYASILRALADKGFVVVSEQRSKDTDASAYARQVGGQVALLIAAGAPPQNITVVGASKGAWIAAIVSSLLVNPRVNYVLIASCPPSMIDEWEKEGMRLNGNVLAIYDAADRQYSGSCEPLFSASEGKGLGRHREIVLHVGTGHGIVYKPLDEWILPTVAWAGQ